MWFNAHFLSKERLYVHRRDDNFKDNHYAVNRPPVYHTKVSQVIPFLNRDSASGLCWTAPLA